MKRFFAALLMLTLLATGIALAAEERLKSGDFTYVVLEDNTAEITGHNKHKGRKLIIPETLGGYRVSSIGSGAIGECEYLEEVVIPNSVVKMASNPFSHCKSLTSIVVSTENPVFATIDGVLFHKPDKKLVSYPRGYTQASYAIPQGILAIGTSAFYKCGSLTEVVIPDSVTSIGNGAFYDCDSLAKLAIPDSVTFIGDRAFYECDSISEVFIPAGVVEMGMNPFWGCGKLASIAVDPENPVLVSIDGVLFDKWEKVLICCPGAYMQASYTIPLGVLTIGDSAFYGCGGVGEVIIPDCVTLIEKAAFSDCTGLRKIAIPNSVTAIHDFTFYNCTGLTEAVIPTGVTSVGGNAFFNCDSLTKVTIPDSVTAIGSFAFGSCDSLAEVFLPSGLTTIEYRSFTGCSNLTKVVIPNGVTTICSGAFDSCVRLTEVVIPDSVTSIEREAFRMCRSLTEVTVPSSVTMIADDAFPPYGLCENLVLYVEAGSVAEAYAKENRLSFKYTENTDWLTA